MITLQVDRHIKVPKDEIAFLEFVGLMFDSSIILEDKLEVRLWSSLKIDRYFYEKYIVSVMRYNRLDTFQVDITVHERSSAHCSKEN